MDFVEIDVLCKEDLKDILTAELCQMGYESFLETSDGFKAYKQHRYVLNTSFKSRKLVDKNWNEDWEKSFEPIETDGKCRIRASFRPAKNSLSFEIIIDPKCPSVQANTRLPGRC